MRRYRLDSSSARWDTLAISETYVQLARRGYAAALEGDLAAIGNLLDPQVKWHGGDLSAPGSCHNREQALRFMRQAHRGGRVGELVDVVGAGDQVVVILRQPAEHGETARLIANLTTFRDGHVVEMVQYPDPEEALRAAGL